MVYPRPLRGHSQGSAEVVAIAFPLGIPLWMVCVCCVGLCCFPLRLRFRFWSSVSRFYFAELDLPKGPWGPLLSMSYNPGRGPADRRPAVAAAISALQLAAHWCLRLSCDSANA